jgi:hypothetical protein
MGVYKLSNAGGITTPRTNYSSFLAGNPRFIQDAYESIATVTVGSGGQSTITFSSIPSTYKHLQLRWFSKNTVSDYGLRAQFNSDTGSNYNFHYLYGNGATIASGASANETYAILGQPSDTTTSVFGVGTVDILDYSATTKFKTTRTLSGYDKNGADSILVFHSSAWRNTAAINSIYLYHSTGNFAQYSSFALYGIKE